MPADPVFDFAFIDADKPAYELYYDPFLLDFDLMV